MKREKRKQKKVGERDRVAERVREGRKRKTETERVRDRKELESVTEEKGKQGREAEKRDRIEGKERDGEEPKDWSPTLRLSLALTYLTICFLLLECSSLGTP